MAVGDARISEVIRSGGADVAAANERMGQSFVQLGEAVNDIGMNKLKVGLMMREDTRAQAQHESILDVHKIEKQNMQNEVSQKYISGLSNAVNTTSYIQKDIDTLEEELASIAKIKTPIAGQEGVGKMGIPVLETSGASMVGLDPASMAYREKNTALQKLKNDKILLQSHIDSSILGALRNPTMVAALLNSDINNEAIGTIFKQGLEGSSPEVVAEASAMLKKTAAAHASLQERRAAAETEASINKEIMRTTVVENVKQKNAVELEQIKQEGRIALEKVKADDGEKAQTTKSLANRFLVEMNNTFFPITEDGSPKIDEDTALAKNIVAVFNSVQDMKYPEAARDYARMTSYIQRFYTKEGKDVVFDKKAFMEKLPLAAASFYDNSPFYTFLQMYGTNVQEIDMGGGIPFMWGLGSKKVSEDKVYSYSPFAMSLKHQAPEAKKNDSEIGKTMSTLPSM